MATPNVFCPRVRAMRVLRGKASKVVDAMEPGGSGDIYAGLSDIQTEVLKEATKWAFRNAAGFPGRRWGQGLMVLAPSIYKIFPDYFTDFWIKPGFAGAQSGQFGIP